MGVSHLASGSAGASDFSSDTSRANSTRPPSPLTRKKLEAMPGYLVRRVIHSGGADLGARRIHVGDLAFTHSTEATADEKIVFVNQLAARVNALPSDKPITLVPVGAYQLLVEELLHQQLSPAHQSQVQYRVIDPCYSKPMIANDAEFESTAKARIAFGQGKRAKPFSSSTAYVSKVDASGKKLLESDKEAGPVVILSVNPTKSLRSLDVDRLRVSLLVNGVFLPLDLIDKANAIVLAVFKKADSGQTAGLSGLHQLYAEPLMLCSVNKAGDFCFKPSPYEGTKDLFESIKKALVSLKAKLKVENEVSPMRALHLCIEKLSSLFNDKYKNKDEKMESAILSEHGVSEAELCENFESSAHPVVFASLDNHEIKIEEVI
jgi:hypothetical protein